MNILIGDKLKSRSDKSLKKIFLSTPGVPGKTGKMIRYHVGKFCTIRPFISLFSADALYAVEAIQCVDLCDFCKWAFFSIFSSP